MRDSMWPIRINNKHMKKLILIFLLLLGAAIGYGQTIKMYSQPSTSSELLENINPGPEVKILDSSINYYHKIEYRGKTGYIAKSMWTKYLTGTLTSPGSGSSTETNSIKSTPSSKPKSTGRTYYTGPRGGCYYINSNGNKSYVDRSLCN
jgi:hypothetical protein